MKNRSLLTALILSLAVAATAFARPDVAPIQDDEDTQLALYMKDINRGLRKLRRAVSDAEKNVESIQDVRAIELLIIKSRNEPPATLSEVPEADRPAFVLEYQESMVEFSQKMLELEHALLKGDNEAAAELYKAISGLKKPAHEKFKG